MESHKHILLPDNIISYSLNIHDFESLKIFIDREMISKWHQPDPKHTY